MKYIMILSILFFTQLSWSTEKIFNSMDVSAELSCDIYKGRITCFIIQSYFHINLEMIKYLMEDSGYVEMKPSPDFLENKYDSKKVSFFKEVNVSSVNGIDYRLQVSPEMAKRLKDRLGNLETKSSLVLDLKTAE